MFAPIQVFFCAAVIVARPHWIEKRILAPWAQWCVEHAPVSQYQTVALAQAAAAKNQYWTAANYAATAVMDKALLEGNAPEAAWDAAWKSMLEELVRLLA